MAGLRDLWVDLGDTARLLRTEQTARQDGWPSLFLGDGYFFEQARAALQRLAAGADPPATAPPLLLTLSATLVEPVRRPGRSPSDEALTHLRFGSGFTFRNPRYPWQRSDFPVDTQTGEVWSRLALAARTTSSFPVAFEAALVHSARPAGFADPPVSSGANLTVDMGGVFQDRGSPDGRTGGFIVSDGGILDNIPLGRALDAIVEAPADGPTDRYLVYVQPGAPAPSQAESDLDSLRRRRASFAVLQGLMSARLPSEDIIADLRELDSHNTLVERAISLRRSGFDQVRSQADLLRTARDAWPGYRRLRADEDQRLVSGLLDDPLGHLREDPFPSHVGGQPVDEGRWRSPLDAPRGPGGRPVSRERLAVALAERFHDRLPAAFPNPGEGASTEPGDVLPIITAGALPLLRLSQLLVEWAQQVEVSSPEAGRLKGRLYRVAAFVREAIERPRRLGWVTLAATAPEDLDEAGFVEGSRVLGRLATMPREQAQDICAALVHGAGDGDGILRAGVASRLAALDTLPGRAWWAGSGAAIDTGEPADIAESVDSQESADLVDLRSEILTAVLVPTARQLRGLVPPASEPTTAGDFLDRALDDEITATTLMALEVVAYPEFAGGLPARRPVRFRRLSAGNPTPLAARFIALLADAEAQGMWWDPQVTEPGEQQGIHLNLKLAGNELANFSAFLRDAWRRNDWMWGRLDAVPTLVDLLLAGDAFTRARPQAVDDRWIDDLVAGAEDGAWREFLRADLLDDEIRDVIRSEVGSEGSCPTLRRVLTAARQWEILAEELLPEGVDAIPDPAAALVAAVGRYRTGAETIRDDHIRSDARRRLKDITDVAGNVFVYCSQLQLGGRYFGEPRNPSVLGWATNKTIDWIGSFAVGRITRR